MNGKAILGNGWYSEENDGEHIFRWMKREAEIRLPAPSGGAICYLKIVAGHSFGHEASPRLTVFSGNRVLGERIIPPSFGVHLFPFESVGDAGFSLCLDKVFRVPGETRDLGVMIRNIEIVNPADLSEPVYGEGWFGAEIGDLVPFRWMERKGRVVIPENPRPGGARFLSFKAFSEFADFSQVLTVVRSGRALAEIPLRHHWNHYSVSLDPSQGAEIAEQAPLSELLFSVNKLFPARYHPNDPRPLGFKMGPLEFHDDESSHARARFSLENARKNFIEMTTGKTSLESFPTSLGIDIFGRCNIRPPCVYCHWENAKRLEKGHVNDLIDASVIAGYGPFFKASRILVNCSFGEPFLHPGIAEILELIAGNDKMAEMSTNGQAFTDENIRSLAGKPVTLYVSLDAATAETYAKIRNGHWETALRGLEKLNEARKKTGNLPKLFMVFMPMKVNRNELEAYFKLCRNLDADFLVLRPLLPLPGCGFVTERGGYVFDYEAEGLDAGEIREIAALAETCSKKYGIPVANQFDFGLPPEQGRTAGDEKREKK